MADLNPNRANESLVLAYVSGANFVGGEAPATLTLAQLGNTIYAQVKGSTAVAPGTTSTPAVFDTALDSTDPLVARMVPDGPASVSVSVANLTPTPDEWFTCTMDLTVVAGKIRFTLHAPATGWPGNAGDSILSIEDMQIHYMAEAQANRDFWPV
jgi:hypothetical protein